MPELCVSELVSKAYKLLWEQLILDTEYGLRCVPPRKPQEELLYALQYFELVLLYFEPAEDTESALHALRSAERWITNITEPSGEIGLPYSCRKARKVFGQAISLVEQQRNAGA